MGYYKLDFISIALILLHMSQCSGQQPCRHTTFIELQSKHQSSLEGDDISFCKVAMRCIIYSNCEDKHLIYFTRF